MRDIPEGHLEKIYNSVKGHTYIGFIVLVVLIIVPNILIRMGLSNIAAGIGIFIAVLFFLGYITVPVLIILYFSGLSFFGLASRMNKDFTSDRILVMLKRAAAINLISRNKINMMHRNRFLKVCSRYAYSAENN